MEYDFIQELDNGYTIYGKNFDQLHKKELGLIYNRLVEYMVLKIWILLKKLLKLKN